VIRLATGLYAIASVAQGDVPAELRSATNTYFLSLQDADRVQCSVPPLIPFGTATTLQPLAPKWAYLAGLYEKRLTHAVCACANGLFVVRTLLQAPQLDAAAAEALLGNLLALDLVVVGAGSPKVLYRVAANCLLAGPPDYGETVQALQRALQLPALPSQTELLPTAAQAFSLAASVLDVGGAAVRREDVAAVLPAGASLEAQSLTAWQAAPMLYTVTLTIFAVAGQPTDNSLLVDFRDADLSARVSVSYCAMRPLVPGDTEATVRTQLRRIVEDDVRAALLPHPGGQSALDGLTRTLGDALASHVNAAHLFQDAVTVGTKLTYQATSGLTTMLPSNERVVVPAYALSAEAPLLGAYISAAAVLGLHVTFVDWQRAAARSGVMLL